MHIIIFKEVKTILTNCLIPNKLLYFILVFILGFYFIQSLTLIDGYLLLNQVHLFLIEQITIE